MSGAGLGENDLLVDEEDGLAILRLNRPERLNALSAAMLERFALEAPRLAAAPRIRAILITGAGKAFCAGGDVGAMHGSGGPESVRAGMSACHAWLQALRNTDTIVIAAVNGVAAGGGFGLAMIADIIVASETASFKPAFNQLGAAADYGLGFTLPRCVGAARAADILLGGKTLSAREALDMGIVSRMFPTATLAEEALALARSLAGAPRAAQLTKRLLRFEEADAFRRYLEHEAQAQAEAFQSQDFAEGLAAFKEKRAPRFRGH